MEERWKQISVQVDPDGSSQGKHEQENQEFRRVVQENIRRLNRADAFELLIHRYEMTISQANHFLETTV
jgi:hypothetical protein